MTEHSQQYHDLTDPGQSFGLHGVPALCYRHCALRRGLSLEGYMELIILLAIVAIGLVTVLA